MNTTATINELAKEYIRFQNMDKDQLDFKDHVMLYESLTQKLDKIGMSYYDMGVYVDRMGTSNT